MKKTDNFFVIDNFNTIPTDILEYCNNYIIYDASTDKVIYEELLKRQLKCKHITRTGHNISTYFSFFADYYETLPNVMCLTKGHMIGRHCSKEFFDRVYDNKYFTYLYEDKNVSLKEDVNFLAMENQYLEINNSWYVSSENHPHKYFDNFNRLLKFIYKDPVLPKYCIFSPGACYIVLKEQVLKHSKEFYSNLNRIMSYDINPNFPSEAHQIERMLPIIFESNYEENVWMNDAKMFNAKIIQEMNITKEHNKKKIWKVLRRG